MIQVRVELGSLIRACEAQPRRTFTMRGTPTPSSSVRSMSGALPRRSKGLTGIGRNSNNSPMTAKKTTHRDRVGREIRRAGQPRGLSFSGSDKNALDSPAGSVDVYENPEFKR